MDATYHNLAGGSFLQDWSNTNLITTTNNGMDPLNTAGYENVLSIIGFQGRDDSGSPPAVNPQLVLDPRIAATDTPPGRIAILANEVSPNTLITGGVAEFDSLANPVVALQGSGTSDAPFLLFHIDATGINNVRVQYKLRDVDGSADNSIQPVALQYRVGTTGNFTDVPAGFVADASNGPNDATLVTDINTIVPGNVSQLQIRVITTNAIGNDEWIGVDDIAISNGDIATPGALSFSAASYSNIEGTGNATITINRLGGSSGAVSVRAQTVVGGSATAGSDYTVVDQIVNFADGQLTATFDVPVINDNDIENAETVSLLLSDVTGGASIGSQSTATLIIGDNDGAAPAGVVLNEIEVDPAGVDNPFEYVEIRGGASQALLNTYFVSIEGDAGSVIGQVTLAQDLSNVLTGSNGLLMIKSPTGGHTPAGGTTVVTNVGLDVGALQNGSNSFLVVFSPLPILTGADLDTNDDGTLDLPAGASVVDGVAWLDGGNIADRAYGNAVLTLTTGVNPPDAATRFVGNNNQNNAEAWFYGNLEGTNDSLSYNQATVTTTNPNGIPTGTVVLTPGAANYNGATGTVTATADFVFNAYPTPQTITIVFSGDVGASLDTSDITLTNITTSTVIPAGSISLAYNSGTNTASFTFPSFGLGGSLPDGNYTLSLPAANVTPNLDTDLNFSFFAYSGDGNRDRAVNINDFSTLAANFNQSPRTFSQGDYDYNGIVNISDFSILASKFNRTLPAPADLPRAASAPVASLFSGKKIAEDSLIDLVA